MELLFKECMTPMDREFYLLKKDYDLSVAKLERTYLGDTAVNSFIESGNETVSKVAGSVSDFISGLVEKVLKLIRGFFTMIQNALGTDKTNMTAADFFGSETGQVSLACDYKKMNDRIDDQIRKENKLLQAISNATGVDDKKVEDTIKTTKGIAKEFAPIVATSALAWVTRSAIHKALHSDEKEAKHIENCVKESDTPEVKQQKKKLCASIVGHMSERVQMAKNMERDLHKKTAAKKAAKKEN